MPRSCRRRWKSRASSCDAASAQKAPSASAPLCRAETEADAGGPSKARASKAREESKAAQSCRGAASGKALKLCGFSILETSDQTILHEPSSLLARECNVVDTPAIMSPAAKQCAVLGLCDDAFGETWPRHHSALPTIYISGNKPRRAERIRGWMFLDKPHAIEKLIAGARRRN